jgi:hypothetical protein
VSLHRRGTFAACLRRGVVVVASEKNLHLVFGARKWALSCLTRHHIGVPDLRLEQGGRCVRVGIDLLRHMFGAKEGMCCHAGVVTCMGDSRETVVGKKKKREVRERERSDRCEDTPGTRGVPRVPGWGESLSKSPTHVSSERGAVTAQIGKGSQPPFGTREGLVTGKPSPSCVWGKGRGWRRETEEVLVFGDFEGGGEQRKQRGALRTYQLA